MRSRSLEDTQICKSSGEKREEEPGLVVVLVSLGFWTDYHWLEQWMLAAVGYSFENCVS